MKIFGVLVVFTFTLHLKSAQSWEPGTVLPFSCTMEYRNGEWGEPALYMDTKGNFSFTCNGIQFSQMVFDSFRWFYGPDGKFRIFQAPYKLERINYGAPILNMPTIPREKLFRCLKIFMEGAKENNYLPDPARNQSIYFQANLISTGNTLILGEAKELFAAVTGRITNDLFANTKEAVRVRVETERRRNFDGSLIYVKTASNYASTFGPDRKTKEMGYDISLWLYNHKCKKQCIAELSMANVFFVMKDQNDANKRVLVTMREKYIVFPGSFRNATIEISQLFPNLSFRKQCVQINNLATLVENGIILEMFATGHFVNVIAITEVLYNGKQIKIPTMEQPNSVFRQLKNTLHGYFFGTNRTGFYSKFMYCPNDETNTLESCRD